MRACWLLLTVVAVAAGCGGGGGSSEQHDRTKLLECVRQTNSTMLATRPDAILVSFMTADGLSSIEHVAVGFDKGAADVVAGSSAARALRLGTPSWKEFHGDVEVHGFGPYEPAIGKRRGISVAAAATAGLALDRAARAAIEKCLKQTER